MSKIKKALATIGAVLTIATQTLGQTSASLEAITSLEKSDTYIRPTITKVLPLDIKASSFAEFYQSGDYYGKTTLKKETSKDVGIKAQALYGTGLKTKMGIGAYTKVPTPKGVHLEVSGLPLWIDKKGSLQHRNVLAYYASVDLPLDMKLSSFGEIDLADKKWLYGELGLEKKLGEDLTISYQPALKGKGGLAPKIEHRLDLKYKL